MTPADHSDKQTRAVVVMDVVESTRHYQLDEDSQIDRSIALAERIGPEVLAGTGGRVVRSRGDGLMLEFPELRPAVDAALSIHRRINAENEGLPPDHRMLLRMALDSCRVVVGRHDLYGEDLVITERVLALAGPGEIVTTARTRAVLAGAAIDTKVEMADLGDVFVKHVPNKVRVYRIGPGGPNPLIGTGPSVGDLLPTIAVIPFRTRIAEEADHAVLGELLADDIIQAMSRSPELNVISRLSTTTLRNSPLDLGALAEQLKANYVLSGAYSVNAGRITLDVELAETGSGHVIWAERIRDAITDLLAQEEEMTWLIVAHSSAAIISHELGLTRERPLPTLNSYTLMMSAVSYLHRFSLTDYERARELLEALIERARRQPLPQAWLAKWYVMRVHQGWSDDPDLDAQRALDCTKAALDANPECTLALAMDGLVHTNLLRRLDIASKRYDEAIRINPNEGIAWLLRGTLHAYKGEGDDAVTCTERALKLSPLDPHRSYYDSLAATAQLSAGHYEEALALARRSYQANRTHASTLRVLASVLWKTGRHTEARHTVDELLRLEPGMTVSGWLKRSPAAAYPIGAEWASLLRQAGVPR